MGELLVSSNPHLSVIHPYSLESVGTGIIATGGTALISTASNLIGQDIARYVPFNIYKYTRITRFFVYNGATVNGNIDIAVYDRAGVRLGTLGPQAQSGVSVLQTFDLIGPGKDFYLGPGLFYMALASSSATATAFAGTSTDQILKLLGFARESGLSAGTLPANATFATETGTLFFVFGIINEATAQI